MMIGALSMAIIMKTFSGFCLRGGEQRRKNDQETKDIEKCMKGSKEAYYDNIIDQTMSDSFIAANMG